MLEEVVLYAFQQCVYYVSKVPRHVRLGPERPPPGPPARPPTLGPPTPASPSVSPAPGPSGPPAPLCPLCPLARCPSHRQPSISLLWETAALPVLTPLPGPPPPVPSAPPQELS